MILLQNLSSPKHATQLYINQKQTGASPLPELMTQLVRNPNNASAHLNPNQQLPNTHFRVPRPRSEAKHHHLEQLNMLRCSSRQHKIGKRVRIACFGGVGLVHCVSIRVSSLSMKYRDSCTYCWGGGSYDGCDLIAASASKT